ncbi:hypothetical protein [Zhongshania sp.]|jgi:NADPH-dependent 7-cyano-7-deazaguanine reductase QueF|uniref:hypothetical protein n=1 Tax=Zhongshania sp. TaxID=1971902 RepID=UPI0039E60A31
MVALSGGRAALLQDIITHHEHQRFHEQGLEPMIIDIVMRCDVDIFDIQAFYIRRGGLDIGLFHRTDSTPQPLTRLNRQQIARRVNE